MTQVITTRELLRDFKHWRMKLAKGNPDSLEIPIADDNIMKITVIRKKTPFERLCEKIRKKPIHITRPKEDLFDERK